ncbi:uncharacterized protein LOC120423457 [Culex pipiens pallens]|uniref:uncharacterized protein LOC120423457 n=1 Tax=Culex pipiens pallens TaxID=42434 RepID=UPI0022AB3EC4|nr:uncharacterized protein LOC120423457 [Culex pipiens pallens]
MNLSVAFFVVFLSLLKHSNAVLSVDFDDDFRECGNGKPMVGMDFSNFQIIPENNGSVTLNGTVKFTKDYENPTKWNLYTERLDRGSWVPGIVAREVNNICISLQMPNEPWYPYARHMKQKTCPFRAGHEEHANNMNIGNYAAMFNVPPDFLGEWRLYYAVATTRRGKRFEECMMIPVTVSEV